MQTPARSVSPSCRWVSAAVAVGLLLGGTGCGRQHFRDRADRDVMGVLTQKNVFPAWKIGNWHVYPHPDARYADPSNPDHPPYPPDDYAARVLSPNPQHPTKKSGTGRFEGYGYMNYLARWDAQNRGMEEAQPKQNEGLATHPEKIPAPKPKDQEPLAPAAFRPGIPGLSPQVGVAQSPGLVGPTHVTGKRGATPEIPTVAPPASPAALPTAGPEKSTNQSLAPSALPPIPSLPPAPTIIETRQPTGMIVAVGDVPDGNRTVPVVALIPTAQPPDKLPEPLLPQDPTAQPKKDGGPGSGPAPSPVVAVATGDAASDYLKALETNQQGYRILLNQAVELGVLNAREFQDRREDLYLAALPVTLQRFDFGAQAFFLQQLVRENAGRNVPGGARNLWQLDTEAGFGRLFPSGATLLVRLANQFVIDMTGDRPQTSLSSLGLTLAQPLFRDGGYAVTLEPLTLSERNLLYAIRSYARFRKLYYVAVAAGGGITNNPYSFQGLSVNLGRGIGGNLTAPSVGFLPLLVQSAQIANQRRNIVALERLLRLYEAFREGGQQSDLQVSQVEQDLLRARTGLLGSAGGGGGGGGGGGSGIRGYLDSLDNFKLQLGLPLTVGLDLDPAPLRPIREQLARFDALYADIQQVEQAARQYLPNEPVNRFRPRWRLLLTESPLARGTEFAKSIVARWGRWEKLTDEQLAQELRKLNEERRKLLDQRADRQAKGLPEPDDEARRLNELSADIDLALFEQALRFYESQPWLKEKSDTARAGVQAAAFRDVFNSFYQLVLEARNDRLATIRQQWPQLPGVVINGVNLLDVPLDDAYTSAIQTALSQRLDLMNARGQVVDAWRQIKVQANSLQGVLDVRYDLNSGTPPGTTDFLSFAASRSTNRLTINAELPLIRRVERNNYRAALISYQRQRRTLQAFEDNIANDVRTDLRELRTIAELYRIQQRLIELGYFQVDNAQAILLAPPAPGAQTDAGSAAALTNQVLQAQQSLVGAQNTLYTLWVNYLTSRMTLYLDLELMQLDERGVWTDELIPGNENPARPGPARPDGERLPAPRSVPGNDR